MNSECSTSNCIFLHYGINFLCRRCYCSSIIFLTSTLLYLHWLSHNLPFLPVSVIHDDPPSFSCSLLLYSNSFALSSLCTSLSVLPLNSLCCSPTLSFALLPTHFHFLFICERKSCLWAAQSQSLRDSLHLSTWKRLLIMSLDFGGIIGRHIQTEWRIH